MKRRSIIVTVFIVLLMAACTKETQQTVFAPAGYWRGNAYLFHTAIMNRVDGTSRIYFRIVGTDTANTEAKADGFFTVIGNTFKAQYYYNKDTFFLESYNVSANLISGKMFSSLTPEIIDLDLRKQP